MITISAGKILYGVAGTASAVDYTVMGKLGHFSEEHSTLAQGTLGTTSAALYAPDANDKVLIDTIILANTTSSDVTGVKILLHTYQVSPSLTVPANGVAIYDATGWHILTASGGSLVQVTGVTQTDTFWLGAGSALPRVTAGAAEASPAETTTNKVNYQYLDFDADTSENCQWQRPLPHNYNGGTITYHVVWNAASGVGIVEWWLRAQVIGNGDVLDGAFGTPIKVVDTSMNATMLHSSPESDAVTIANTPNADDMAVFELFRGADGAGDTLTADARMIGVLVTYTKLTTV